MNWKEEATRKLRAYETMRLALVNLPREIDRLEAEYTGIGSQRFTGRVTAREQRSREERMLDNIVKRQELRWSLDQTKLWMQTVNEALDSLESDEQNVLRQLYICPKTGGLERLCEAMCLEKSSIYRKRDSALRKFTLAMYGAMESN